MCTVSHSCRVSSKAANQSQTGRLAVWREFGGGWPAQTDPTGCLDCVVNVCRQYTPSPPPPAAAASSVGICTLARYSLSPSFRLHQCQWASVCLIFVRKHLLDAASEHWVESIDASHYLPTPQRQKRAPFAPPPPPVPRCLLTPIDLCLSP